MSAAIEMQDIDMAFSGVQVLKKIHLTLKPGEIKGLVGKNGAGKSTLLKIVEGIHTPTGGTIRILGREITRSTPKRERSRSVGMIFQDFSLAPYMTVVENIFLNNELMKGMLIDEKKSRRLVDEFFTKHNISINPDSLVKDLNTSDMQMVEICKCVLKNKKIILMDEPTAALEAEQTEKLFAIIDALRKEGISIVLITHHLNEIMRVCDSVAVLRDGEMVMEAEIKDIKLEDIIAAMLGQEPEAIAHERASLYIDTSIPLLEVRDLTSASIRTPLSFKLYAGEVLGLAGLKGSGRTELFQILFGIEPATSGNIFIHGKEISIRHPKTAVANGIFLVPENRQTLGLSIEHTLYLNMQLPWLKSFTRNFLVEDKRLKTRVRDFIDKIHIKTNSADTVIRNLSGGNQQKVVVAKALGTQPKIILMDDPTYGVDIHAKTEIMRIIDEFKKSGGAVMLASSEIEEVSGNCNRILTMRNRRITGELRNDDFKTVTQEILAAAIQ